MDVTSVVYNARIRTEDDQRRSAQALAFRDGRIVAVGSNEAVLAAAGPLADLWDVRGASVLPGFVDAHQHPAITMLYGGGIPLRAPQVTDIATLQAALREAAARLAPGAWVVGTHWDELLLAERRAPTRSELDDAVPDRPVFALHYTCHSGVANSRALELAGIARNTPDPSGGHISRDRNGVPDGNLLERGMSRVECLARTSLCTSDAEGFFTRVGEHYRALAAAGITCIVDAAVPSDLGTLYREAHARGKVTLPTVLMPVSTTGYLETPWEALEGPPTGTQDGLLSVGPVKLYMDGAPSCAICFSWWQFAGVALSTLALCVRRGSLDPIRAVGSVRPRVGRRIETGIRIYQPNEARDLIRAAAERGFAVAAHAVGNVAIEMALDAYAAARSGLDRAGAPRLEHVEFADRDLAVRIAGSGVTVVTQPGLLSLPAFEHAPAIPGMRTLPLRWLLDSGVLVAGSSDFPVTDFDPLISLRCAVRRTVKGGDAHEPDQAVTLDEALTLHTRNGARAAGRFAELGSLEAGKRADFVVLTGPLEKDADLDAVRVRTTVSGGKVVHGAFG